MKIMKLYQIRGRDDAAKNARSSASQGFYKPEMSEYYVHVCNIHLPDITDLLEIDDDDDNLPANLILTMFMQTAMDWHKACGQEYEEGLIEPLLPQIKTPNGYINDMHCMTEGDIIELDGEFWLIGNRFNPLPNEKFAGAVETTAETE